jgi:hypothetical protein
MVKTRIAMSQANPEEWLPNHVVNTGLIIPPT